MKALDIFKPVLTGVGVGIGLYGAESVIVKIRSAFKKDDDENVSRQKIDYSYEHAYDPDKYCRLILAHDDGSMYIQIADAKHFIDVADELKSMFENYGTLTGADILSAVGYPDDMFPVYEWENYRDWCYWETFDPSWIEHDLHAIKFPACALMQRYYDSKKNEPAEGTN